MEAESLVKMNRRAVGRPHFQKSSSATAGMRLLERFPEQRLSDVLTAILRMDGDRGDLHLIGDEPADAVTNDLRVDRGHQGQRGIAALELGEEVPARPGLRKIGALDLQNGGQVFEGHTADDDGGHDRSA